MVQLMVSLRFPTISTSSSSRQSYSYICSHITPIRPPQGSVISVGQWSIRRIFLIMPRMKCRCPYSALAMIGHAPSVERLYPTVGKHELQGSVCEASLPKFGFGHERGRRFPELRGHFQIVVLYPVALRCYHYTFAVLRRGFNGQLPSCKSYSYICRHISPIRPPQ